MLWMKPLRQVVWRDGFNAPLDLIGASFQRYGHDAMTQNAKKLEHDLSADWQTDLSNDLSDGQSPEPCGLASTDTTHTSDTAETAETADILTVQNLDIPKLVSYVSVALPGLPDDVARYVVNVFKRRVLSGPSQINDKFTLNLAVKLKGIAELQSHDAEDFELLIRWLYEQWADSPNDQGWQAVWQRWQYDWTWAKPGNNQPWQAYVFAMDAPFPPEAENYNSGPLRLLVAICRKMGEHFADDKGVWYLGCRDAADLIGIHETIANRWLRMLVKDGVLSYAQPYRRGTRKAQRFRYLGSAIRKPKRSKSNKRNSTAAN